LWWKEIEPKSSFVRTDKNDPKRENSTGVLPIDPISFVSYRPMVFATMANTPIPAHDNPIMLGVNTHIPAHAQPPRFPAAPSHEQSWSTATRPEYTYFPVAPVAPSLPYDHTHHVKREREGHQEQEYNIPVSDGIASPSNGKKQRPSNYRPPQQVDKKSVVAVTGSLVGGSWEQNGTTVRMRRELSGGQLDQFFRTHDSMEEDDCCRARPRSMSF
jgi:hypothetical protein